MVVLCVCVSEMMMMSIFIAHHSINFSTQYAEGSLNKM